MNPPTWCQIPFNDDGKGSEMGNLKPFERKTKFPYCRRLLKDRAKTNSLSNPFSVFFLHSQSFGHQHRFIHSTYKPPKNGSTSQCLQCLRGGIATFPNSSITRRLSGPLTMARDKIRHPLPSPPPCQLGASRERLMGRLLKLLPFNFERR